MRHTKDELAQNVAERLCWEVARRDDSRVARRLYRKQEVDGVYRLDEGAVLDDFFHFLQAIRVMALLEEVHGTAIQREMLPYVQYVLLYGVKTLFNGAIRALAKAGVFGAKVTGIADGTDLETTERDTGCGQVTRKVRIEDKRGQVHEIEVTVYGWKVL